MLAFIRFLISAVYYPLRIKNTVHIQEADIMKKMKFLMTALCILSAAQTYASTPQAKVMNGDTAIQDLLPWQVMLVSSQGSLCGGSIISDHWIVTAAHCAVKNDSGTSTAVLNKGDYVFVGQTKSPISNGVLDISNAISVEEVIYHSNFKYDENDSSTNFNDDIAVVRVKNSLFAQGGKAISIATAKEQSDADKSFEQYYVKNQDSKATLIASGWGHLGTQNKIADELQVVELAGIPDNQCNTYSQTGNFFVCADSNKANVKKDVCRGDSGGPLVWQNPANSADTDKGLRLIGATSNGALCSLKNKGIVDNNGLYTQVPYYRTWIEGKTGLSLSSLPKASYKYDPFNPHWKTVKPKQPTSGSNGGGGTMPLSGLLVLGLFGWLRRNK